MVKLNLFKFLVKYGKGLICPNIEGKYPAGTWRLYNVALINVDRNVMTLYRRLCNCINVACPLGRYMRRNSQIMQSVRKGPLHYIRTTKRRSAFTSAQSVHSFLRTVHVKREQGHWWDCANVQTGLYNRCLHKNTWSFCWHVYFAIYS